MPLKTTGISASGTVVAADEKKRKKESLASSNDIDIVLKSGSMYRISYDKWLRSFQLTPSWETHKDCIEPHIWHGYRPNPSSFSYCFKSAFYPTNETFNMWTHLLAAVLMVWKTILIFTHIENPTDEITYPLWAYSFGCCFVLFSSAAAHLLNCYSVTAQELCFCIDYGSIGVFGLTLAISFQYMTCPYHCFGVSIGVDSFPCSYITMVFVLMVVAVHLTCRSRSPDCSLRYLYRFGPYALSYGIAGFPCVIRFLTTEYPDFVTSLGFPVPGARTCYLGGDHTLNYVAHLTFFLAGVFFVATRFPESVFPGIFDVVGHSHQWFHVCVALGMYMQYSMTEDALFEALQLVEVEEMEEDLNFNIWSIFGPLVFLVIFVALFSVYTAKKTSAEVKSERESNK